MSEVPNRVWLMPPPVWLGPVLVQVQRLREAGLDSGLVLLLPEGLLPGATVVHGLPARHYNGADTLVCHHITGR